MKSSPIRCHFERHSIEYFFRPTAASYANYLLLRQLHVYKVNNVFAQPPIQHPPTQSPFDFFFFTIFKSIHRVVGKEINKVRRGSFFYVFDVCFLFILHLLPFFTNSILFLGGRTNKKKKTKEKSLRVSLDCVSPFLSTYFYFFLFFFCIEAKFWCCVGKVHQR
jgi:hypothetical protein